MAGTPSTSATRHSARIEAQEEAKRKQAEEEEKANKKRKAYLRDNHLPEDDSLEFNTQTENVRGYRITRKYLRKTADKAVIGVWACKAFHENPKDPKESIFYPGQIIQATTPYPQTDLKAPYNEDQGQIAMTKAGPVGCKNRYLVILWSTSFGVFALPMYTLQGTSYKYLADERKKDFVMIQTEAHRDAPGDTSHAGLPIVMNINPEAENLYKISSTAYIDMSRAHTISRHDYLEENIGSIDGDEYLRLLSLYLFRQEDWLQAAFEKFDTKWDIDKLLKPLDPKWGRPKFYDLPKWARDMADVEFKGQFNSERKKDRRFVVAGGGGGTKKKVHKK